MASYRCILQREVDEEGLKHHVERLLSGIGKEAVLISLLNSREAASLEAGERSGQLAERPQLRLELESLRKKNRKDLLRRIFSHTPFEKKMNALTFRLELSISYLIARTTEDLSNEILTVLSEQANNKSMLKNYNIPGSVQARRRADAGLTGQH